MKSIGGNTAAIAVGANCVDNDNRQLCLQQSSRDPGGVDTRLETDPLYLLPNALIVAEIASGVLDTACSRTTWPAASMMHTDVRATETFKPM